MAAMNRCDLLKKIQEIEFVCLDMNLYLDTHPDDRNAVAAYNSFANQLAQLKCTYETYYGPLLNFGFSPSKYPWQWIEEPWPWEPEYYHNQK